MVVGDGYVYHWTSYNNNMLALTPSSGVEWMFTASVSSYADSNNGVRLLTTAAGSAMSASMWVSGTSNPQLSYKVSASGASGMNTLNIKLVATNSYPLRYGHFSYSSTMYSRFMAIQINE